MTNGYTNGLTNGDSDYEDLKPDIDLFGSLLPASHLGGRTLGKTPHTFARLTTIRSPRPSNHDQASNSHDPFISGPQMTSYQISLLFPLLTSYPPIFRFESRPEKLAITASLSTSTLVADKLKGLEFAVRRALGVEEREALCDGLVGMAEEYTEGWSSGEEEGEDE